MRVLWLRLSLSAYPGGKFSGGDFREGAGLYSYSWGRVMSPRSAITAVIYVVGIGIVPISSIAAESATSAEKVVKEAHEAVEAAKQYTAQQKEAFQHSAQEELAVLQRQILGLRTKIENSSESTRADLQKSISELEKKKDGVKEKVDELKNATDTKWHEVRERMNRALDELERSYRKLLADLP